MKRLILFGFLLFSMPAQALTVLQLNAEQMTHLSKWVFVGECTEVKTVRLRNVGKAIEVTFAVEDMIKGPRQNTITYRQIASLQGEPSIGADLPTYEVGEESLVFLSEEGPKGLTAPIGIFQGKFDMVTNTNGTRYIRNGVNNKGLFVGLKKSPQFKSLKINTAEKNMIQQNGGALPLETFTSLVKKYVSQE